MTSAAPRLSVLIVSTAPLLEVPTWLLTTLPHCRDPRVELIVTYAADSDLPLALGAGSGDPVFIRLPHPASLPQLLGAALARARGEIIAITDATCAVDEHWVPAILAAHAAPHPVIGGVVEPDGLRSLVDWAAYFYDYGRFMAPMAARAARLVPGINISLKRSALTTGRRFVEGEFWKGQWCQHLQAEGISLYLNPEIVVRYRKSFTFRSFLCRWFHHGQCFAGMRLTQLSALERGVYFLGSPLLPLVFCWRFLRDVLPKRRYRRQLVRCFPLIVLAMVSWALGEWVGYLCGPGASCQQVR